MSLTDELYALDTPKDPTDTVKLIRSWSWTRRQTIILAGVIVGSLIAVTSLIVTTVAVVSIAQVFL